MADPPGYPQAPRPNATTLDPQTFTYDSAELYRCCLGRTLLSYNGQPTASGGADLRPDLAIAMPSVAADGLTWTFHLRTGLRYAPPEQNTEIVAGDFIRALARTARMPNAAPVSYSMIRGYDAFAAGMTSSIAGLESPDAHTLVVRLTQPDGDLGNRLSLPNTAPIPPLRREPGAQEGVYTGRDSGIGGFIVSSGPYMIDGTNTLDLEAPLAQQQEPRGFVAGQSLTLVRNPNWRASTDALRPALPDRIVIDFALSQLQAAAAIDTGRDDIAFSSDAPPASQVSAYERDPRLGRVEIDAAGVVRYVSMNLATPPFDDVHVRRAVAYVIDRAALVAADGGPSVGAATGHIAVDSLEDDALLTYDAYAGSDAATRLRLAEEEMAQSQYDSAHSGQCGSPVCQRVNALALVGDGHPPAFGTIVRDDLALIGIHLDVHDVAGHAYFQRIGDPTTHVPMAIGWGWGQDFPNGSDFFTGLFSHDAIARGSGFSLLGARPDELQRWGYAASPVPGVDDRIDLCLPLVGGTQARCWAALDEYMVEKVVATVPIVTKRYVQVIPARVTAYSYDQAFNFPALDRIAVASQSVAPT